MKLAGRQKKIGAAYLTTAAPVKNKEILEMLILIIIDYFTLSIASQIVLKMSLMSPMPLMSTDLP
jgi:hypothetical protein